MKNRTNDALTGLICGVLTLICILMFMQAADAGEGHKPPPPNINNSQHNPTAESNALSNAASDSSSNNELSIGGDSVENNSSTVVLVPNNNTESCVRVWGLAFGKNGESGAIGVPWRSKACDYEQAADDAFAAGERELGWFWKCQNKNLYKPFMTKGMDKSEAQELCHQRAVGEFNNLKAIGNLQKQLDVVNEQRTFERQKCAESTRRITDAWKESCAK